ncbi:MAG: hypothetical protein KR126chlam6_00736 [Candidatus Anoxychlamydiales bacterium]|nr:hypothetical protein [Candidatus Anoxychlamydiales bacterium]
MKRKYIYLVIVLVTAIIIYIVSRGLISHKKHFTSTQNYLKPNSLTKNPMLLASTNDLLSNFLFFQKENLDTQSTDPKSKKNFFISSFNPDISDKTNFNSQITDPNISKRSYSVFQKDLMDRLIASNMYKDLLKNTTDIKSSESIDKQNHFQNLNLINANPFKDINIIYNPLFKESYDLFRKNLPIRVYVGSDDMGVDAISRNRNYTGINLHNNFLIDTVLSYQFTTALDIHEFKEHTAHLILNLPKNIISLYADYSQFEPDLKDPILTKDERFRLNTSFRYDISLPKVKSYAHDFILGFDYKRADTNLPYSSKISFNDPTINVSELQLSYTGNIEYKFYQAKFAIEQFFSLDSFLPDEENEKYDEVRRFSKTSFMYSRTYLSNIFKLPNDFSILLNFRGQISNSNLLPSESLAIGGYNTVRGYLENEILADLGLILNLEIKTKKISLIPNKKINDGFEFLLFLDYGLATIYEPLLFEEKNRSILGYGPAIRYDINNYFSTRLDWGIKGIKETDNDTSSSLLHFSLNLSY